MNENVNDDQVLDPTTQEGDASTSDSTEGVQDNREPSKEQGSDKALDLENMSDEQIKQAATEWGHRPKEAHRGDPDKWQDAREFLEKSIKKTPALIHQNKKQRQIIESQKMIIANQKKDLERQANALAPKMKEAFESGDYTEYRKLENEEKELLQQSKDFDKHIVEDAEPENSNSRNEEYAMQANMWVRNNPEYNTNPQIKATIDRNFDRYREEYPDANPSRIMEALDMDMKKIKSQQNNSYNNYATKPSNMGKKSNTKSYNNLTQSAKRVCDQFVRAGHNREDYIKNASDTLFIWNNK